ncbi:hypothetical protein [Microcoleus sp. FACHB-672]|uniref:hypothetical protein n=1 Tax=Microcoleus sp. FACHB-672 TaxID=2692825 RepID=UPI001683C3C1|nr:hypothetical protein [Microcoleus sp. FACHB-672]MBD2042512.1 hypothetical protein [Microcoleus sp. FACHB-672]
MKKILKIVIFYCLLVSITPILVSCGEVSSNQNSQPAENNSLQPDKDADDTMQFKLKEGTNTFSIKPVVGGAKFLDATEKEIAQFTIGTNSKQFRINSAAGKVLGYAAIKGSAWTIENAEQTKELYILSRQEDGNYQLKNEAGKEIYRIKLRDYGFEIETPAKQSLYKVKIEEDKIVLIDASDQIFLYTNSALPPLMLVCFGFEDLNIEQQAALAYAVNLSGGR